MSGLDSGTLGTELVTDLGELARGREFALREYGYRIPLQPAEREAGLSEDDIWQFVRDEERAAE
ncbi:hypothetical protein ACLQ3K_25905 [Tsukamurella sp. DT100]|uniref:hypothetical protein n=1 Tax=Tsukamurella sp. DT100 TaxID=3393415 RepID=UPI003CF7AB00